MNTLPAAWLFDFSSLNDDATEHLLMTLSLAEFTRANTLKNPQRRQSFIATRALAYSALKTYFPTTASSWTIASEGQPLVSTLTGENIVSMPRLSLSHSGNYALCAITNNDSLIGCDIETHKPRVNIDAIAKNFFTENEALLLSNLNAAEKERFFYRLWTCKEAWLKAQGLGIANGLKRLQINATDFSIDNDAIINHDWQFFTASQQDYSIALAVHDKNKLSYEINYVAWDFLSENFYSKQCEVMTA